MHFLLAAACLALDEGAVGKTVDLDTKKCFYSQCKLRVRLEGIFLCVSKYFNAGLFCTH